MSRHRDILVEAVLPPPPGWPPWSSVDLPAFWATFRAAAPAHLRLGMGMAAVLFGVVLPVLLTGRTLRALHPDGRDALLQRVDAWAPAALLLEIVKVVAALAYFDHPPTCAAARGEP